MQPEEDYQVVIATDPSSLTSQVRAFQKQEWETTGGVAITEVHEEGEGEQVQWAQAMVKRSR